MLHDPGLTWTAAASKYMIIIIFRSPLDQPRRGPCVRYGANVP